MLVEVNKLVLLPRPFRAGPYRVVAFCNLVIDGCFVVTGVRALAGPKGIAAAMPDAKVKVDCPNCEKKVEAGDQFCRWCALAFVGADKLDLVEDAKFFRDVCHPADQATRDLVNRAVADAVKAARAQRNVPASMVA